MCNVSQGRVSQWLTEGKIDGAAIVGTGRSAMIDVDLAMAQVKSRRAVACGLKGLSTNLDGGAPTADDPVLQVREGEAIGTVAAPAKPFSHCLTAVSLKHSLKLYRPRFLGHRRRG
jgi:hypothetical protein